MHDIDRTTAEFNSGLEEFEYDDSAYEYDDSEYGYDSQYEIFDNREVASPLDDADEMELAEELLSVTDDAEMDQFLGKLFKKVRRRVGRFMKSPIGRRLGGMLKQQAKKFLPQITGKLGSIGGFDPSMLSGILGSELEGLAPEDQEFEAARGYVRLAAEAAKNATKAPATADPGQAAKSALVKAANRHAPGLLRDTPTMSPLGPKRSGRWIRRGRKIIILGA